ncbi:type I polyketide synthase [Aspergillus alliaceus]|uniref:type I polyketide synthase n=1 Tax=Petromyces alliaceus TaxID=209559 RepID=UPI0012A4C3EB|nr:uncharacterized protein BDW43DRAFT_313646 [Aspergillus alliaceus]KAB8230841.1 hypothetical protein BDW43DRAFT_313646 [Aspergillus alliaceus]
MDSQESSSQASSIYTPECYDCTSSSPDRIAIVGMSCRMPGDVSNPVEFWNMCARARSGWTETPAERFSPDAYYHPNPGKKGTHNARGGHFLSENISLFDAPFFNVTAAEATAMDPQQRLLLEGTYEAFENAGISKSEVVGQNIGVFMGGYGADYQLLGHKDTETVPMYFATGTCKGLMSNRVSYYFDLKGPSFTIDTACSSSLVALHLACQSLRAGESSAAVVGGVHLNLSPDSFATMSSQRLFSETGKSYAFDHRGTSGYGRGEGVGCLILKRLSDALESNDRIRAVIVNSGTNQDGRTNGITLPNGSAQEDLIRSVYRKANISPEDVGFVEAHGTGTKVGDPIEATALANVLGKGRPADDPLLVGSVKTNVGHLEAASGVASVIKAAMMLERGFILPNCDYEKFPTSISSSLNIKVPTHQTPWPNNKKYISINNFGFGGSNAHVVLEKGSRPAAPVEVSVDAPGSDQREPRRLFVLSAHDEKAAQASMENLIVYLERKPEAFEINMPRNLAYTLGERRSIMPWRIAFTATGSSDLTRQLVDRQSRPVRAKELTTVAFVFTGQGAQWHAMGRELLTTYPVFFTTLRATDAALDKLGAGFSLIEELSKNKDASRVNEPQISQPICTAIQIALVDLLRSWNIKPSAVTGHSSGEIASAYATNALSLEDCMAIAYHRGRTAMLLVGNSKLPRGTMLAVGVGPDEVKNIIGTISHGRIGIACVNSPKSVTISGDKAGVIQLDQILEEKGIFHRLLNVNVAYHSHHMQVVAEDYRASIAHIQPKRDCSAVRFHSSLRGHLIDTRELTADYWVQNLTSTVLFSDSLSELCSYDDTVNNLNGVKFRTTVLLEIGPHSALEGPIKQTVSKGFSDGSLVYSSMLRRNKDATETAQKAAGDLFMRGIPVNMAAINRPAPGTSLPQVLTDMPPYPFQHDNAYWHSSRFTQKYLSKEIPARNDILGVLADYSNDLTPEWRNVFQLDDLPWLRDHKVQGIVTYPMAGFIAMGMEAIIQHPRLVLGNGKKAGNNRDESYNTIKRINLRNFAIQRPLVLDEDVEVEMVTKLSPFMLGPHTQSDTWSEFVVTSWTQQRGWIQHCRGLVSADTESTPSQGSKHIDGAGEARDGISPRVSHFYNEEDCILTTDYEVMYDSLQAAGTGYGQMFRGLRNIAKSSTGELAVAELLVQDTASIMPHGCETSYMVHPTILESSFQAIWPLLGAGTTGLDTLYMVTAVQQMSVSCRIRNDSKSQLRVSAAPELASQPLHSASQKSNGVRREADSSFSVVVTASDNHDQALIRLNGLKVLPVHQSEDTGIKQSSRGLCYKLDWKSVFEDTVLDSGSSSGADTCSEGSNELSFALLDLVTIIYRQEDQFDVAFKLSKSLESLTGTLVELQPFDTNADVATTPSGVVIVLIEIGKSFLPFLSDKEFQWMKKTILQSSSLLWVSQIAYAGHQDPNSHLAMGLARCIRAETDKKFAVLDLEANTPNSTNSPVKDIITHVTEVFTRSLSPPGQVGSPYPCSDMEYRVRNGQLQVPRVVYDDKADNFVQSEAHGQHVIEEQPFFSRDKDIRPPLKLSVSTPGVLNSLYFIPDPVVGTPLEADEVEIEIKATAVNSRDISQAMGHLPAKSIGLECSGVITQIGSRVKCFSVGDRVCAVNTKGAYSQLTRCRYTSVSKIPEDMTFVTAAMIPAAYCTAYYSLIKMARLSKGESVLIHAGTSDVGLAAIKLAQYVGAEIYVTVKSDVERMFLMHSFKDSLPEDRILHYGDSSFAPAFRQATSKHGQEGVDVIVNSSSVSGDRLRETWECIAHFGRFIEIGKRDIEADVGLPMRPFDYNAAFYGVDIITIANEKPQLMKQLISDVMTMIRNGIISPLAAGHTKQISEVGEAFGLVQSGEVINKLVVLHGAEERVKAPIPSLPVTLLHASATYIVVGGTGGLGRAIARWMISKGARNLLLISRSGSTNGKVAQLIQDAMTFGATITVKQCDITDRSHVRKVLQSVVSANKPPVRGLIQGSMVFENTLFEDMQYPLWYNVSAPKVAGTWNLHHEIQAGGHQLDFFIMLSSISGIIGSRGQAPYAAANAFLDGFAAFRQSLGLPATTLDIAPVLDAGRLAEDNLGDVKVFSERFASDAITKNEVMALLGAAISGALPATQPQCVTGLKLTDESIKFRFWAQDPKFESLLKEAELSRGDSSDAPSSVKCLDVLIKEAQAEGEAQAVDVVYTALANKIADILMIPAEDILPTSSVVTCGLDSLAAVEFRNWMTRELNAQLQILEIITSSNLEVLSRTVLSRRK